MRRSGVLLPIASLPSAYGIGTFSKEAYEFVDFLAQAGQKLWQILPLGPTGYGDSPYQSFSTFAGNPYYIDLEVLIQEGFLTEKECRAADLQDTEACVNYEKQYKNRSPLSSSFMNTLILTVSIPRGMFTNPSVSPSLMPKLRISSALITA